jgi:hypothetical protein
MADEMDLPGDNDDRAPRDEEMPDSEPDQPTEGRLTEVAVIRVDAAPIVPWRRAALAVRAAAPQLIRNPVVVGASAAVATVAVRLALEAAQRALGGSTSRPQNLTVSGSILHEVRVVRHVHVVHHVVHHHPYGSLPDGSRWPHP